jgi:putative membrane protein
MRHLLIILLMVFASSAASAHDVANAATDSRWTFDLKVIIPLALSLGLYASGVFRLWLRAGVGRGIRRSQVRCFTFGWCALALALISPLHWLGERLFLAHMIEHEILMVVAAPLIVLAQPFGGIMWGLPQGARMLVARILRSAPLAVAWSVLIQPRTAAFLHGLAIWAWHMPKLFDAALENSWLHWAQHLSFLLTGLLFWWALLRANARRGAYGTSVLLLFVTMLHCSLLGVLITLSRRPLYLSQTGGWGLSPLEDQQAAGLAMWIPPGIVYGIVALIFAARWARLTGQSGTGSFAPE